MSVSGVLNPTARPGHEPELPRAFHRLWSPFWIAFVGWQWWSDLEHQLAAALPAEASQIPVRAAAGLGAAGHVAGNAVEALFYCAWWRARGVRLSFARLFEWLVTISVLDLLASGLTRVAESHPGWLAGAIEVFVGLGALRNGEAGIESGFRAAFGSCGLLCIARLIGTAAIQQRGSGRGLAAPLGLTVAVWLGARLSNWWLTDLLRGMSPLP